MHLRKGFTKIKKTIKIKSHKEFEPAILIQKHFNNVIQNNNIDNIQSCTLYRLTVLVHFKNLNAFCVQQILNSKRKKNYSDNEACCIIIKTHVHA